MKEKEKIFKALANHRRLQILIFLNQRDSVCVIDIARHLRLSLKSTSKHLKILTSTSFLDWDQRGPNRFYFLTSNHSEYLKLVLH